jgi:O-antigen/teichoic acid export membrane protein
MGIIGRQATYNLVINYAGIVLGAVNVLLLFPRMAGETEMGLVTTLGSIAALLVQAAALGLVNVLTRYFPYHRTADKKHNGFVAWVLGVALLGFAVVAVLYVLGRPLIVLAYQEKAGLLLQYFYWALPLTFFLLAFTMLEALASVVFRTVFSSFLREVLLRLLVTISLLLLGGGVVTFAQFVWLYVGAHGVVALLQWGELLLSRDFAWHTPLGDAVAAQRTEMLRFGLYSFLAGASLIVVQNIDRLMLAGMAGLDTVSIYTRFAYMGIVVSIPARSLGRIMRPMVAEAWAQADHAKLQDLYRRTSIVQMATGAFIFLVIWACLPGIVRVIDNRGDLAPNQLIFFFIGLSYLADMTAGINALIIMTSARYVWDIIFNLVFVVVHVLLNMVFIPQWGGVGAAAAVAAAFVLINFAKWWFVWRAFGMQPFYRNHLRMLLLAVGMIVLMAWVPSVSNTWADVVLRGAGVSVLLLAGLYALNISDDLTAQMAGLPARIRQVLKRK